MTADTVNALKQSLAELARCHIESSRHPKQHIAVLLNDAQIEATMHAIDIVLHPDIDAAK